LGHETTYKQERAQCNYCSHKLLAAANRTKVSHHSFNIVW
ncbi:383_t:CDS:2, partial [Entrophospora sp. SA101]